MLPAIQENILLLKSFQVATQILLCLLLCHLMGEAFFRLPSAFRARSLAGSKRITPFIDRSPGSLSGWRTGLFLVLCLAFNLLALKIAYRTAILPGIFWGALTFVFVTGVILLLWARQHAFQHDFLTGLFFLLGLEGEALLFGVVFLLLNGESLLLQPEMWPFVAARPVLFGSWHGLIRFIEFDLLALLLATAVRLRSDAGSPPARAHLWSLAAIFLLPFCLFLELALLPDLARTLTHFILAGLFLGTAGIAAIFLTTSCMGRSKVGTPLLGTICFLVVFWVLGSFVAREKMLTPVVLAGLDGLEEISQSQMVQAETSPTGDLEKLFTTEEKPAAPAADVEEGEALYNRKCTVCHRFDQRLVGPPLLSVLPKYRDDSESLQAFLKNPVKKNPDYPAMPNLKLTDRETTALAEFLLAEIAGREPHQSTDNP